LFRHIIALEQNFAGEPIGQVIIPDGSNCDVKLSGVDVWTKLCGGRPAIENSLDHRDVVSTSFHDFF